MWLMKTRGTPPHVAAHMAGVEVLVDSWILSSGKIKEMLEGLEHAETQPAHLSDLAPDDHQCDVPLCILLRRAVDID